MKETNVKTDERFRPPARKRERKWVVVEKSFLVTVLRSATMEIKLETRAKTRAKAKETVLREAAQKAFAPAANSIMNKVVSLKEQRAE